MSRPQDVRIKEAGHLLKEAGGVGCFFLLFFLSAHSRMLIVLRYGGLQIILSDTKFYNTICY